MYECDFSAFTTPGEYVLAVDGVGCSYPFRVGPDIYQEPFYWVMKALFENRSGIELKASYAQYARLSPLLFRRPPLRFAGPRR